MNILIVGNGFDLSHYLPTKYDHFMVAMGAIENWDEQKGEMSFDDLFGSLYEKENYFFKYTKAMYQTDEIKISIDQIKDLKQKLKENVWYQYFSDHVREVKTWIDFEEKIYKSLLVVNVFFEKYKSIKEKNGSVYNEISGIFGEASNSVYLTLLERERLILKSLGVFDIKTNHDNELYISYCIRDNFLDIFRKDIMLNAQKIVDILMMQLSDLKSIFNSYLATVVDGVEVNVSLNSILSLDLMYTFNYTSTLEKKYKQKRTSVRHIHGETEKGNIVLGVSDLENSFLKNYKAYGFTKYHQKLLLETDFQFLCEEKVVKDKIRFWDELQRNISESYYDTQVAKNNNINIFIWGHSLDISDESYINEIFSLNDMMDRFVRVVIYYFNYQAKFDLLANLLHILGKEKVERWMKKGWLKFEPNPDIIKINNIQPVDLPKFEK
ncbi:hypothetical protein GPS63_11390 [Acinetobacter haemolyticus]|uniref:AbiH family protein n=1 Tax=Acinetobacter haemolyticus TaxID=29430 RepID=UPI001331DCCD|nr:AbiH family protein [Acinetobacter haemolyticus]NAR18897.1 hypothetical protein [Acinetobacter haemolyticus]QHI18759.1 hypothetical protein AhaeAN3_01680 [Acinetobacter haemolyticus]